MELSTFNNPAIQTPDVRHWTSDEHFAQVPTQIQNFSTSILASPSGFVLLSEVYCLIA